MNYDEARQIAETGKWNWTTMNDGAVRTAQPCYYPDFDWDAPAVREAVVRGERIEPTGRERCDHANREDAERHRWRWELSRMHPGDRIDHVTARQLHRCDVPDCPEWADYEVWARGGDDLLGLRNWLCEPHLKTDSLEALHPFRPGMRSIHS